MTDLRVPRWFQTPIAALAVLLAMGLALSGLATSAIAQDEMMDMPARPVHIHEGTCAELGGVALPLTDLTLNAQPEGEMGEVSGNTDSFSVEASMSTVEASLETILSANHAINAHESADNIQNYIVCGNLGGVVVNDTLHVGLAELNDSGYTGIAILTDNGDDTTNVAVYISATSDEGMDAGAMDDTDMDDTDMDDTDMDDTDMDDEDMGMAGDATVGMAGLTFAPGTLEVTVGTTVTFMNDDSIAHTVTSTDGAFDSGNIPAGESWEYTFDEPGEYPYVCIYHGNMSATVIVTE